MALTQAQIDELDKYYAASTPAPDEDATQAQVDKYIAGDQGGYLGSVDAQNDLASQARGTTQITIRPNYKQVPENTPESDKPSLWEDYKNNLSAAGQGAQDLAAGNYQGIGDGGTLAVGPKEASLQDKLLKGLGDDPSIWNIIKTAAGNAGDIPASEGSGALLEAFGRTPEAKAMQVIGGVNPLYNASSIAYNRAVKPAIMKTTGIDGDNLDLAMMLASPFGLKQAAKTSDPALNVLRYINSKMGEASGNEPITSLAQYVGGGASNIRKGFNAPAIDDVNLANDTMGAQAGKIFEGMPNVKYSANSVNGMMDNIHKDLSSGGGLDSDLHAGVVKRLEKMQSKSDESGGLTISDLHKSQQLLSQMARETDIKGNATPNAAKAAQAIEAIDNHMENFEGKDLAGTKGYTAKDLAEATAEHESLKNVESSLIASVKQKAALASKQLGVFRRKTISSAAQEAKSLAGIRKQVRAQKAKVDAITKELGSAGEKAKNTAKANAELKRGKAAWKQYRQSQQIAGLLEKAGGDRAAIKQKFKAFADKTFTGGKTGGFTPLQIKAIKAAGKHSWGEGMLTLFGKAGFDIGTGSKPGNAVIPLIETGGAIGAGSPLAVAAITAATGARYASKMIARGKGQRALESITNPIAETSPIAPAQTAPIPRPTLGQFAGSAAKSLALDNINSAGVNTALQANQPTPQQNQTTLTPDQIAQLDAYYAKSDTGVPTDIAHDEGLRHSVYDDTTGHKTIGFGFNMDSKIAQRVWKDAGMQKSFNDVYSGKQKISDAEANALGRVSVQIAQSDAADVYPDFPKLSESRQAALTNLSYNLGKGSLSNLGAFNTAVNNGQWQRAVYALLTSKYAQNDPTRMRNIARGLLRGS